MNHNKNTCSNLNTHDNVVLCAEALWDVMHAESLCMLLSALEGKL